MNNAVIYDQQNRRNPYSTCLHMFLTLAVDMRGWIQSVSKMLSITIFTHVESKYKKQSNTAAYSLKKHNRESATLWQWQQALIIISFTKEGLLAMLLY